MRRPLIGKLDKRVQLASATETRGAPGGTAYAYTVYATVWAKVELDKDGMEIVEASTGAGALTPRRMWRVTIRRRTGISAKHRVVYRGKQLNISSVGDDASREEYMELVCTENAP